MHTATDGSADRRAFTLVELLIGVASISIVAGLLIPTMASVRASAREAACLAMQRRLHVATMTYARSDDDRIPGVNTTSARYLKPITAANALLGDSTPTTPTTIFDWISPIMGHEINLSPNRAERTRQIFNDLACAESRRFNNALWGGGPFLSDYSDFEALLASDGYRQVSYLSPGAFHLAGRAYQQYAEMYVYRWNGPATPPIDYYPRLDRVGNLSHKVFLADGTRYLANVSTLDFDVDPRPKFYGSFTSSSPIYSGSREYGRAHQDVEFAGENHSTWHVYPHNARLSYRHRGRMFVMYFDGHGAALEEAESKTDASRWFPVDSTFTGLRATPESRAFHDVNSRLH